MEKLSNNIIVLIRYKNVLTGRHMKEVEKHANQAHFSNEFGRMIERMLKSNFAFDTKLFQYQYCKKPHSDKPKHAQNSKFLRHKE